MRQERGALLVCAGIMLAGVAGLVREGKGGGEAVWTVSAPVSSAEVTLVLDPGHGGEDGGAVSAAGDRESDINLDIALRLDQLLGFCGVHTVLTRTGDYAIYDEDAHTLREKKVSDLHNRVALVESLPSAALLSIHQNSYPDPRYAGAQVFYGGGEASRLWGEQTQDALRLCLDESNDRKAKEVDSSVYLMSHVKCSALLVECGFLTNGAEASLLLTDTYQKQLAVAVAGGWLRQGQGQGHSSPN